LLTHWPSWHTVHFQVDDVRCLVKNYLDKKNVEDKVYSIFKENTPSQDWVKKFAHRDGLTFRFADKLKPARAAVTSLDVEQYFAYPAEEVEGECDCRSLWLFAGDV